VRSIYTLGKERRPEIDRGGMKKGASLNAAKTAGVAGAGASSRKNQHKAMTEREDQKAAQQAFMEAAITDCSLYMAVEEEDVVEEYRKAGKLHTYDPDKEWQKRFARVVKLHPSCRWHKQILPKIEEYMKFLEEDEDDFRIGLYSLLGEEIDYY
jgi:hypothetical protein